MKQELYHWLYQMDLYRERFSSEEALNTVMLNAVSFYEMVHKNGAHFVGPVNLHEIFIDPIDGHLEVNAGGNRGNLVQDIDSVKFMPPEVLNMKSKWNLEADKFVLAELLFVLRYSKHPYDGRKVLQHPVVSIDTAKQLYSDCRFIFDPEDSSNGLDYYTDPTPIDTWNNEENVELKESFLKVFTLGYLDINRRIDESEWKKLIV